jgi:hypothetical protein
MNDKIAYYNQFEEKMAQALIRLCQECNYIGDQLLEVEELDLKWHEMAPEYMMNAVPDIAKYPMVAIGWASYLGMGMATVWDGDWEQYSKKGRSLSVVCRTSRLGQHGRLHHGDTDGIQT